MIGPVPGVRNYWVAVGVMAGFCQGGGVGRSIAEWMIDGEPSIDVWAMDIARFGEFATPEWGTVKSAENYERRFVMTFPNETLPKGRRQKTTALHDRLVAKGAVMDQGFGLEHALWFADGPGDAHEDPSFRRSRAHDYVGRGGEGGTRGRRLPSRSPTTPSMNSRAPARVPSWTGCWPGACRSRAASRSRRC